MKQRPYPHFPFLILVSALLLLTAPQQALFGQVQDKATKSQLASKYYFNGEYEKAVDLYKELYAQDNSKVYYNYYMKCLRKLGRHGDAASLAQKQLRQYPEALEYYVDLGMAKEEQQDFDAAETTYKKAIRKLTASRTQTVNLANAFLRNRRYDYALHVYEKAGRLNPKANYKMELAAIYMMQRNYQKMINTYMELLGENPKMLDMVQNRLQFIVNKESSAELPDLLRRGLLKHIQDAPGSKVYYDMLIWLYEQQKDFTRALRQAIALDKRLDRHGREVLDVANMARSNDDLETAEKGYDYIISLGRGKPYYIKANQELLQTHYERIVNMGKPSRKEVESLENEYLRFIKEYANKNYNAYLLRDLAHLTAFYLNKPPKGLDYINRALRFTQIPDKLRAQCSLEKADIQVLKGDVWDAALLYAQIEKENKNNPQGYEAKFRKARLAYFTGDFDWAHAQLNVLKASTSKLIANDAFELAEIIDANTEDSSFTELQIFARADLLAWQQKDSLALLTLDSLHQQYPNHSLADEVWYKKAQIYKKHKQYEAYESALKKVIEAYSYDIYGDNALFELATLYEKEYKKKEQAMKLYKQLLTDFPGSIFIAESRKRFRSLRGD